MACRTGCPTQDHGSYRECLKDTSFHTAVGETHCINRKGEQELARYRWARKQGIQPETTRSRDVERAIRMSDRLGGAVNTATGLVVA